MQSKVKETRMQLFSNSLSSSGKLTFQEERPVAEGKLVLVECKFYEGLLALTNGVYATSVPAVSKHGFNPATRIFKPIIISETERIESNKGTTKGDWAYNGMYKKLFQMVGDVTEYDFKVLVLPEQFSPKHLQAIVDGKMKDGDKVLVECGVSKYGKMPCPKCGGQMVLHIPDHMICED